MTDFGPSVRRVQDALAAAGGGHTVIALEQSARTSAQAAIAVGCKVDQIAKSLVFRGEQSQRAVLVIASGANRVDERKVAALIAEPVGRADADFVRQRTGFAIGGVAPVAHSEPLTILIDEDLLRYLGGGRPSEHGLQADTRRPRAHDRGPRRGGQVRGRNLTVQVE